MFDPQEHVFTNEFDDLSILISLVLGTTSASMQVKISGPNGAWDEQILISGRTHSIRTPFQR
jgi:hypothetical protein